MSFASPVLLLALLLVPLAIAGYLLVQRRRSRYVVRFTNVDLLSNLVPRTPAWRRHVPPALYVLALSALVIGLARPSAMLAVPREDATIVLTMDVSGSMLATDVAPSRLDSAKQAASAFIDQLPASFRVGLVTFGTAAQVAVSPTTDRAEVHAALDALQADGGTALGDAIELSLGMAQDVIDAAANSAADPGAGSASPSPPPSAGSSPDPSAPAGASEPPLVATVLLSDGANSTGKLEPAEADRAAAAAGMPIYTIALGTATGVVSVTDEFGVPHTVEVPPDTDTLAAIAETTGARSFEAPTADDLQKIYESLGSRVGVRYEAQEITQWFAAAGLVLMVAGAGLAAHWFNRFP
ncbi:MAG TPA: VWA domain-containing protein [Candidatus Limnocylindrales bacterium]|nr:VWA domain-containing protein [Candidatus Limnocylindrales bacterium]